MGRMACCITGIPMARARHAAQTRDVELDKVVRSNPMALLGYTWQISALSPPSLGAGTRYKYMYYTCGVAGDSPGQGRYRGSLPQNAVTALYLHMAVLHTT